ncbi:MAG TPA: hypothetical protein DDX89_04005 [Candidatus Omnitrophica bacterium]|nr:hypothetical protein [Candidatus Omnitrophota bacterium]
MTRTHAWRKVAEAFGTPPEQRTERQKMLTGCGLCCGIATSDGTFFNKPTIYTQLHHLADGVWSWWPQRPEYAGQRALFAGLMAAMTQRERNLLEPGL